MICLWIGKAQETFTRRLSIYRHRFYWISDDKKKRRRWCKNAKDTFLQWRSHSIWKGEEEIIALIHQYKYRMTLFFFLDHIF